MVCHPVGGQSPGRVSRGQRFMRYLRRQSFCCARVCAPFLFPSTRATARLSQRCPPLRAMGVLVSPIARYGILVSQYEKNGAISFLLACALEVRNPPARGVSRQYLCLKVVVVFVILVMLFCESHRAVTGQKNTFFQEIHKAFTLKHIDYLNRSLSGVLRQNHHQEEEIRSDH